MKEYYYYLDNTPSHAYMKYLYKYPQAAFPYDDLVETNKKRTRDEPEYKLIDTGIFDDDRYFDVFVEYAKDSPEDILVRITVWNRGPEEAVLHLLPTLWFRNTWWLEQGTRRPLLKQVDGAAGASVIQATHPALGVRYLHCEGAADLLFTENETNEERISGTPNTSPYVKDGINDCVVSGRTAVVNPARTGTKASARFPMTIPGGESRVVRLRLNETPPPAPAGAGGEPFGDRFEEILQTRISEADLSYANITPPSLSPDAANVMRQALAGMLWTKQYYFYDLDRWLRQHGSNIALGNKQPVRNNQWFHMYNADIISMPDKWEYPWYAAWDLAFHAIALAMVDPPFAKQQLELILNERYLHPNGQIPAYEWNFSDVNPPVIAWAALYIHRVEQELFGTKDTRFLKNVFQKLLMNFTWWVNRKDRFGRNVFEGGFLGLDNIGVFDRSATIPSGGYLEQSDGTAWMALYCQNMLDIAVTLAADDPVYEEMAIKFYEHFLWIAAAMNRMGADQEGMWDEWDGFYYDLLHMPDGSLDPPESQDPGGAPLRLLEHRLHAGGPPEDARLHRTRTLVQPEASASHREYHVAGPGRVPGPPPPLPGERGAAAPDPDEDAGREGVPERPRDSLHLPGLCREPVLLHPGGGGVPGRIPAGGVQYGHVRRELELAGADLVPDEPHDRPEPAEPVRLLRGNFHRRVPHGLRQSDEPVRGERRDIETARTHLPPRRERPAPGLRRCGEVPGGPALAGLHPLLRVFPRRQRCRPWREPPDGVDRRRRPDYPVICIPDTGTDADADMEAVRLPEKNGFSADDRRGAVIRRERGSSSSLVFPEVSARRTSRAQQIRTGPGDPHGSARVAA